MSFLVPHARSVPSAIAVYAVSLLPASATPLLMSSLSDYLRFDATRAGFIATSGLFALAMGTMLVAVMPRRFSRRVLVVCCAILVILASLVSAVLASFLLLATLQVIAGLCWGILYGTANATLASSPAPDRVFAKAILTVKISAAAMMFILPFMVKWYGQAGIFLFLAVAVLIAFPLMACIPNRIVPAQVLSGRAKSLGIDSGMLAGLLIVLVTTIFFVMNGAVWALAAQIGQLAGFRLDRIGFVLATVIMIGTLGPLTAVWLGTRFGRLSPLVIGISLNVLSILSLALVVDPIAYVLCLIVFDVSFLFIHPYLLGAASELDRSGRWVVTSSSAGMVGFGLAPVIAGFLTQRAGIQSIGWLSVALGALMISMLLKINAYLERARR